MLFPLVRIDSADSKFSKSLMRAVIFLRGNNQVTWSNGWRKQYYLGVIGVKNGANLEFKIILESLRV